MLLRYDFKCAVIFYLLTPIDLVVPRPRLPPVPTVHLSFYISVFMCYVFVFFCFGDVAWIEKWESKMASSPVNLLYYKFTKNHRGVSL